jgi:hypothetical protein
LDHQQEFGVAKKRAGRSGGVNMSQFIRDIFKANPNAKVADANDAWTKAGNKGAITNSLFYITKSKAGLTKARGGKRRGRPAGSKNKTAADSEPSAAPTVKTLKGYYAIEAALDDVVHLLTGLGDTELAGTVRHARRKISAKLV